MHRLAPTPRPRPTDRARPRPAAPRGQSLTEFALTLPIVLILILFGLDFGRVFLGWVTLTNAAREAANFAAMNPDAWGADPSASIQAEYARLVTAETAGANCTMPSVIPDPSFPDGTSLGSPASVSITCTFHLITPVIGDIVGDHVAVSASSAFPVRSGIIEGIPVATASPTPSFSAVSSASLVIASATVSPSSSAGATPTPSASATATPVVSPTPSPTPMCRVPNFKNTNTASAPGTWSAAGFVPGNLIFSPLVGPNNNYSIKDQSLNEGASVACTSAMTVYDKTHH